MIETVTGEEFSRGASIYNHDLMIGEGEDYMAFNIDWWNSKFKSGKKMKVGKKMKIKFTKDFARNWWAGEVVEAELLPNGDTLVDNVAAVDTELLMKHCEVVEAD